MHCAAKEDRMEIVQALLDSTRVDVNKQDESGRFVFALYTGHFIKIRISVQPNPKLLFLN